MRTYRGKKGSAIVETGPSLLILLLFIIFPVIDIMQLGCGYAFAWFMHNQELREASVRTNAQQGCDAATTDFFTNCKGFAAFCGLQQSGVTATATTAAASASNPSETVTVDTACSVRPLLLIPFFKNMPGIGAPLPVHFSTTANREEAGQD